MNNMLKIESLVSTMNANVADLTNKMNIHKDAVVINQTDKYGYNEFKHNNHRIREYMFNERGIGRSRNAALMRAAGDICLMADDDMVYVDDYDQIVNNAFKRYPDADMIMFNVRIHTQDGVETKVPNEGKVSYFNSLRYGTVSFAFKRMKVLKKNIFFSLLFGGSKYGNGEDTIFLWDCLKSGLKIYKTTEIIADVYNNESVWFSGYNEKFFIDRGALFRALSSKYYKPLIYQFALRKQKSYEQDISFKESVRLMKKGAADFGK